MIALAILVPYDGKHMTTIVDVIETEVIPRVLRHEGIHHDATFCLGPKTANTGNHQVVEGGVVIIATAFTVAHQPRAIGLIKVFTDVWSSTMVLALNVKLHLTEERIAQIYLIILSTLIIQIIG